MTTASARNHEYVKVLEAVDVFDYTNQVRILLACMIVLEKRRPSRLVPAMLSQLGGGVLPTVLWPSNGLPEKVKATMGEVFAPCMRTTLCKIGRWKPRTSARPCESNNSKWQVASKTGAADYYGGFDGDSTRNAVAEERYLLKELLLSCKNSVKSLFIDP